MHATWIIACIIALVIATASAAHSQVWKSLVRQPLRNTIHFAPPRNRRSIAGAGHASRSSDFPNPALDMYKAHMTQLDTDITYAQAFARFGIAVPTDESMAFIASVRRPIVEFGSGMGYLAHQLSLRGVNVEAVEPDPWREMKTWYEEWDSLTGVQHEHMTRLFTPTREQFAEDYLVENDLCRGKAILLMNHNMGGNWVETIDWDALKADALVFSFSVNAYHEAFRPIIGHTRTWVWANSTETPKYPTMMGRALTQPLEMWVRRSPRLD